MDIKLRYHKNILIITPRGEMDHHNIEKYRNETDKSFERRNIKNIIFDMSETDFIDSSGIGYILGRYKQTLFVGGKTAVAGSNDAVKKIMSCSGLDKILKMYPSAEAAIAGIGREAGAI